MDNTPAHYRRYGIECEDLTRYMTFPLGNAVKYMFRHNLKGTAKEDVRKALDYLNEYVKYDLKHYEPLFSSDKELSTYTFTVGKLDAMRRSALADKNVSRMEQEFWNALDEFYRSDSLTMRGKYVADMIDSLHLMLTVAEVEF